MAYNLRIGSDNFKIQRLQFEKPKWADVDEKGNEIKKVCKQKSIYAWVDTNDNEIAKRYKLINGKVMDRLTRTKEVKTYKEVDKAEAQDLIAEQTFYVESDNQFLAEKLEKENKALLFAYTTSGYEGGFYKAYLCAENGYLMMYLGNACKSKEILKTKEQNFNKIETKKDSGIARASADDLVSL